MAEGSIAATGTVAARHEELGFLGFTRAQGVAFLALVAFMAISPFFLYPVFLMKILCFGLFACAFNLLIGYVGLLSFGHAAYFGMGAYITGYASKAWGVPPELAILMGGATGALLGLPFGWLAIRRAGIYFAMITAARTASRRSRAARCSACST